MQKEFKKDMQHGSWLISLDQSSKCMEIVSNPTIMDVSHTMDSYGPSSVLLAVIALLLRGALSAAEIGKAHRIQAFAAIHNCVCIQKRSDDYQSESDIYDLRLPISIGDGQHNKAPNSLHSKERWKASALRSRNNQDYLAQSKALWERARVLYLKCNRCGTKKNITTLFLRFVKAALFHSLPNIICIHAVKVCNENKATLFTVQYPQNWFHSARQILLREPQQMIVYSAKGQVWYNLLWKSLILLMLWFNHCICSMTAHLAYRARKTIFLPTKINSLKRCILFMKHVWW